MRNDICYVDERKIRIGLLNVIFLDNRFLVIFRYCNIPFWKK